MDRYNNMKVDPYNHQESYLEWRENVENGVLGISPENGKILLKFLHDMEIGINVGHGSKKGSRSFIRLKTLRDKLIFIMKKTEEIYEIRQIIDISEEKIHSIFSAMNIGKIKKKDGGTYKGVCNYVKIFKTFWHWHQKINKKNGIEIPDITSDLDTTEEKPDWVYLTEQEVKKLCDNAKPEYKVIIMFLFDTGIRAPTELMNIKVSDFYGDFKELQIREEISKTFGRRIKLMICSEIIKNYVLENKLQKEDYLFKISPSVVNRYFKRLAGRVFGEGNSPAGQKYSDLTMYDFRHISCCYWLPRYKSESALKYRFGWKKSDRIHYYSELLGMKDTINEEDMLIDVTKTEIEKRLERSEKEKELLQDKIQTMELQMAKIMELTNRLHERMN